MKDLGARVAVAAVGVPAVFGVLYAGGWILGLPMAVLAALGAGEIYRFAECRGIRPLTWLGIPSAAAVVMAAVAWPDFVSVAPWILGGFMALILIVSASALWFRGPGGAPLGSAAVTLFGVLYAGLPVGTLVLLHALPTHAGWGPLQPSPWSGVAVVALPLAATWVGDAAAYFAGSAWGRTRLYPAVSPGKSWVGAWAGMAGSGLAVVGWWAIVRIHLPGLPVSGAATALALGAILGLGGIVGDLVESLFKREAGMKDSGHLFPGHGGVLDRLDALVFSVPLAYAVLLGLEHFR